MGANMLQPARAIKILVINDSVDFHLLIESYLEDYGIFCLVETDVVQGTATAIREQPDLILFDSDLPGGGPAFPRSTQIQSSHFEHSRYCGNGADHSRHSSQSTSQKCCGSARETY